MTTETDIWRLDTQQAEASLRQMANELKKLGTVYESVEDKTKQATRAQESLSKAIREDLGQAFLTAQGQWVLIQQAIQMVVNVVKESIGAAMEAERADIRLGVALRGLGTSADAAFAGIKDLSDGLERVTGVTAETISEVAALFLRMGVGVHQVAALTEATLDYASATNEDVMSSTKRIIGFIRGEQEEFGKLKLEVGEVTDAKERAHRLIEEISGTMAGTAKSSLKGYSGEWELFKINVGKASEALADFVLSNTMSQPESILGWFVSSMTLPGQIRNFNMVVDEFFGSGEEQIRKGKDRLAAVAQDPSSGPRKITLPAMTVGPGADFKREQWEKNKPWYNKDNDDGHVQAYEVAKKNEEEYLRDVLEANKRAGQEKRDAEAKLAQELLDVREEEREHSRELALQAHQREKEELARHHEEVKQQFKDFGMSVAGFYADMWAHSLVSNTKFNKEFRKLSLERRQIELQEQGIIKSRAEVEKEMADEEKAEGQKRLAAFLANIAKDAGMRGLFEAAQAAAALATGRMDAAAKHGIASGLFFGVAAAAGAGAAKISSGRGMTTDERQTIEDLEARNKERRERDADQATDVVAGPQGPTIVVYNIGISGQTEVAQARELERIQKQFSNLKTGA